MLEHHWTSTELFDHPLAMLDGVVGYNVNIFPVKENPVAYYS